MNSINYHHRGAPKQWYGVPGTKHDADGVERVFKSYLSMKMRDVPDLLHHITTSFSPRLLNKEGVRVCKLLQNEGEFIVTFPRAFHAGFSLGPNCGEAVNFADANWMPHAADANERYRTFGRPSVFSHDRLVYTMAHHINSLRSKEACIAVAQELRRLMQEELQLRQKLINAGVRDVSKDVELPPNRLDQLDEESADYDDKRLCHSCEFITTAVSLNPFSPDTHFYFPLSAQASIFAFSRPFAVNVLTIKSLAYAIVITCAGAPSSENISSFGRLKAK
jgi:histone demethylase JARID1